MKHAPRSTRGWTIARLKDIFPIFWSVQIVSATCIGIPGSTINLQSCAFISGCMHCAGASGGAFTENEASEDLSEGTSFENLQMYCKLRNGEHGEAWKEGKGGEEVHAHGAA